MSLRLFTIVKQQSTVIIERFGKYHKILNPGFHLMVPLMDKIAYRQSLKEQSMNIDQSPYITKDNVTIQIDGAIFTKIDDPWSASYKIQNPYEAIRLLTLTVLRSEIGKMKLDNIFQERKQLSASVTEMVNKGSQEWGIICKKMEILNIDPASEIRNSMQQEAEAERYKRRDILVSQASQTSEINLSEAARQSQVLKAEGEAQSIQLVSAKEAEGLRLISQAIGKDESKKVIKYILTQSHIKNYNKTLKYGNIVVAPESSGNSGNDLTTMAAMFMMMNKGQPTAQNNDSRQQQYESLKDQLGQINSNNKSQNDSLKVPEFYNDPDLYSSDDEIGSNSRYKK